MSREDTALELGVDVGSISAKVVVMDRGGRILTEIYRRIQGRPVETTIAILEELTRRYGAERLRQIAFTGTAGKLLAQELGALFVNEVVAQARAEAELYPTVRTIIEIGGEDSKLIQLKEEQGRLVIDDFAMNSVCAAGTGSFLDQQANRLGVSIEDEFGALAMKSVTVPRIAGRCTVFAKSDMIHLQQKATPDYDIIAGLCFALARNFKGNLGRGRAFRKPIAFQGGVAANKGVVRAFTEILELQPGELIIPKHFASMGAIGAVLNRRDDMTDSPFAGADALGGFLKHRPAARRRPRLPQQRREPHQARTYRNDNHNGKLDIYLGIDVGSISTNVVAIDAERKVVAKVYLMTAGRPIEAVRDGLRIIGKEIDDSAVVRGVGTTGSGRHLTGDFVGADCVRNEITAQATAAVHIDPEVDTIFEIGGQDSKYISIDNGVVVDFQMNHVCAAGTGSFLEEQAEKLGINIKEEFGRMALACERPVRLGERCTVFMESDLVQHQQRGARTDELVSGLCYSIVHNYLNRVVGTRRVGKRIFFQGGTAFNDGVVAAFRAVTGKDITVPANHEVTGAIGAAILAMEAQRARGGDAPSSFRGFDLSERKYTLKRFQCDDCPNACEINEVVIEGETPLYYGSRCDKYNLRKKHKPIPPERDLFRKREALLTACMKETTAVTPTRGKLGIPRALVQHEMLPFWYTLMREIGYEVVVSPHTNRAVITQGVEAVTTETCFPVKVAHGHVLALIERGVDAVLLPSVINTEPEFKGQDNACFCPYVQSIPYVIRAAIDFPPSVTMITFPIAFRDGRKGAMKDLIVAAQQYGWPRSELRRAFKLAMHAQKRFQNACHREGQRVLDALTPEDRPVVVVARPYNGCDRGVNLDLPRKLADLDMLAIPMDFLPLDASTLLGPDEGELPHEWDNMYWRYGQKIMAAATYACKHPQLTTVYITNFSCGPDSFLTTFFRKAMGEKPALLLEIDEHSADAGVITRLEAFLDSLKGAADRSRHVGTPVVAPRSTVRSNGRCIYVPCMCDHAYAFAAAFRNAGIACEVLPESDETSLELGRRFTTGKECLPAIITAGDMLKRVLAPDFDRDRSAFFMPGGTGPCRFGQYSRLHRYLLKEVGYADVPILSPNQGPSFYDDFRKLKRDPTRLAWQGMTATDLLIRTVHRIRPYELEAGTTDVVFAQAIENLCDVIETDGDLDDVLRACVRDFAAIPTTTTESGRRPVVGVVGEIYVRSHAFSNGNLVRQLESLGAEVALAGFPEWIYYTNFIRMRRSRRTRNFARAVKELLKNWVQKTDERRIAEAFVDLLDDPGPIEPSTESLLNLAAPYLHDTFEGEAVLSIGKTVEHARHGHSGVVNVMPFTCMPGAIVTAVLKPVREDYHQIPVVSLAYDGQAEGNTLTRLEAFMHQVKEFHRRSRRSTGRIHIDVAAG